MAISTISVMISITAQYALRAVVYLTNRNDGFVSRLEIAESTFVPHDYLLKVLNELDRAGIVQSRRGPGGGYRLTKPPEKITALEVVLSVDEIPRIQQCPLGLANHERLCPLHRLLDNASKLVEDSFRQTSIADLVLDRKQTKSCDFPLKKTN